MGVVGRFWEQYRESFEIPLITRKQNEGLIRHFEELLYLVESMKCRGLGTHQNRVLRKLMCIKQCK